VESNGKSHARSVEQIVEQQVRLWEERRRLERSAEQDRRNLTRLGEGPWITLCRLRGTGTAALAERLAKRLEWHVYDHEIIEILARQRDQSERILALHDERAMSRWEEVLSSFMRDVILSSASEKVGIVRETMKVVWALARQGKAIILGHGANWFLDQRFGLRVHVVAPFKQRVAAFAGTEGIGAAVAERRLRENDAEFRAYVRQFFGNDLDDPLGYDLILNMGTLDQETAAETVLAALRRKLAGQSASLSQATIG